MISASRGGNLKTAEEGAGEGPLLFARIRSVLKNSRNSSLAVMISQASRRVVPSGSTCLDPSTSFAGNTDNGSEP